MKRLILKLICVTILVFYVGSFSAMGSKIERNNQLVKFYENYINEKISSCHLKFQLKESRSENLQKCAAMEIIKAIFLKRDREALIEEMINSNVGVKEYKIEYFLNKKFFESNDLHKGKKS